MDQIKKYLSNPKQIRKAIVALVACIMLAVAQGLVPDQVSVWINVLQPLLVAYGVYRVPNADDPEA